jgi:hypothetical protein
MLKIIEDPQLLTNNSIDPTPATPQELHILQHSTEYGWKLQRVHVTLSNAWCLPKTRTGEGGIMSRVALGDANISTWEIPTDNAVYTFMNLKLLYT